MQPRYEINAPDLYIPTMAYITYVLAASLVLGMSYVMNSSNVLNTPYITYIF